MGSKLKLLREAVRPRDMVPILLNGEIRYQIEAAERELGRLGTSQGADKRMGNKAEAAERKALEDRIERLYEQAAEHTMWVVLEGMQRTPYRALVALHPPRKDEDGSVIPLDARMGVNSDTFMPALASATIIGYRDEPDPQAEIHPMSDEDIEQLIEWCTEGQLDALTAVALKLSARDDAGPLWRRRSETRNSGAE
jgi:hypothetical protein